MTEPASHALIVGCGYLGMRVGTRLVERGVRVYATTRDTRRAQTLAGLGFQPLIVSVTQPLTFAALRPAIEAAQLDVYYLVPPGRPGQSPSPRQVVLGGIAHMVRQLRSANLRRALLTSSSAVYAQQHGQQVDASTPANPTGERGKLLLGGEGLWLAENQPNLGDDDDDDADPTNALSLFHVVRLAGLYGPGRVIGLRQVADGSPIVGNPASLLNLIHVDDAADLLLAIMSADQPASVELGCDGHPIPRQDYYQHVAEVLGKPAPPVLDNETAAERLGLNPARLRSASSKALDNIPTCRRTGWSPHYANYRQGVEAAIKHSR